MKIRVLKSHELISFPILKTFLLRLMKILMNTMFLMLFNDMCPYLEDLCNSVNQYFPWSLFPVYSRPAFPTLFHSPLYIHSSHSSLNTAKPLYRWLVPCLECACLHFAWNILSSSFYFYLNVIFSNSVKPTLTWLWTTAMWSIFVVLGTCVLPCVFIHFVIHHHCVIERALLWGSQTWVFLFQICMRLIHVWFVNSKQYKHTYN